VTFALLFAKGTTLLTVSSIQLLGGAAMAPMPRLILITIRIAAGIGKPEAIPNGLRPQPLER
jgi:hypothetical protein